MATTSCSNSAPPLADEPILSPPPRATLLARYEQEGTPGPVAVQSHVSRLYASPAAVGEVLRFYLEDAAAAYEFPDVDRGEALRRGWVQMLGSSREDPDVGFEVFVSDEPLQLVGGGGALHIVAEAPPSARTWVRVTASR